MQQSPFTRRALAGQLPAASRDDRRTDATDRVIPFTVANLQRERITIATGSYTVADLQRSIATDKDNER